MTKFKNKGWDFYHAMIDINPSAEARGDFAFSPGIYDTAPTVDGSHHIEQGLADISMDNASDHEDAGGQEDATLVGNASTATSSMKRKAMDPPEINPQTASTSHSGARTSSAASTVASTATSSKRKRSNKAEVPSQSVFLNQLLNEQTHATSRIEDSLRMLNADPLTDAQVKATNIVKDDRDIPALQKIRLFRIFASQPRLVTSFLEVQDNAELRQLLIDNLLEWPEAQRV